MEIILIIAIGYASFLIAWTLYLAIMNLKRVRDSLHPVIKANAYVLLFIGYISDVIFNAVFGSVLFLEPPKEWLFTDRLRRHKRTGGKRGDMARWLCEHLLNQFDVGHC